MKRRVYSYRLFSIHSLHPQTPVGLRQSLQGNDAMSERQREQHPADLISAVSLCLSAIFLSHLSTTSMSKQKRLSMDSLFLLTHERNLNISGGTFTTPFCRQGEKQRNSSIFTVSVSQINSPD